MPTAGNHPPSSSFFFFFITNIREPARPRHDMREKNNERPPTKDQGTRQGKDNAANNAKMQKHPVRGAPYCQNALARKRVPSSELTAVGFWSLHPQKGDLGPYPHSARGSRRDHPRAGPPEPKCKAHWRSVKPHSQTQDQNDQRMRKPNASTVDRPQKGFRTVPIDMENQNQKPRPAKTEQLKKTNGKTRQDKLKKN